MLCNNGMVVAKHIFFSEDHMLSGAFPAYIANIHILRWQRDLENRNVMQ
jgi:hypothetical protein